MEETRTNPLHRMANRLTSGKVLVLSFAAVLLVGLLWILFPLFDGASEIFFPGSTSYMIELFIVGAAVILLHIICFILTALYKRSAKYLVYMLIPLCLLEAANSLLYPSELSRTDKRINSFQLGARYRVSWAGGASKVRQEALSLLAETSEISPSRSQWPDSIQALYPSAVTVNKETGQVDVEIPRRRFFFWGDQFGYLITDANTTEPTIVNDPPLVYGHRLWKIADGIYLYEKW